MAFPPFRRSAFSALVVGLGVAGLMVIVSATGKPGQLGVTTLSPADGQSVSGSITWAVSVSGGTPTRVEFAIDGAVKWTQKAAPYLYGGAANGLDTTQLSNGSHTLTATAYGEKGTRTRSSRITVTVDNPASARVYWGAWIGDQLTGRAPPWDMSAVSKFEQMTGKPLSLLHFSAPFANCSTSPCSFYSFPWTPFNDIRAHGAIPFFSWSSVSIPASANEPDFQLSDLIAGNYDTYIRNFATRAREWGHPFFLRFDWEMNGNWFAWSERANGNDAEPGRV